MTPMNTDTLKFPSGRSVNNVKKDAKRLAKKLNIHLDQAQTLTAKENGLTLPWDKVIGHLKATNCEPQPLGYTTPL